MRMRNIDLLPRKKVSEAYLPLWILLISVVGITLMIGQIVFGQTQMIQHERTQEQIVYLDTRIATQQQKLVQDDRTTRFNSLRQEVDRLKDNKKDWLSDIVYVFGFLPESAQIVRMHVNSTATLVSELEFETIAGYLAFIEKLQAEPRFHSIKVNEITMKAPASERLVEPESPTMPSVSVPKDVLLEQLLPEGIEYGNVGQQLLEWLEQKSSVSPQLNNDYSSFLGEGSPYQLEEIWNKSQNAYVESGAGAEVIEEIIIEPRTFYLVKLEVQLREAGD